MASLTLRLIQNDVEAFNEIYIQYYNRLLRCGGVITQDKEVVADVIQDLFIWIWQDRRELERINNLQVYLFKALKRNLLRYLSTQYHLVRELQHSDILNYHPSIEDR